MLGQFEEVRLALQVRRLQRAFDGGDQLVFGHRHRGAPECGPCPNVTSVLWRGLRSRDVFLFGMAKRPRLIALDALARNPAHRRIVELSAYRAGSGQWLVDRVDAHVRHPADRPHRTTFTEHRKDLDALSEGQLKT